MNIFGLFSLFGGLAMFLYGMNVMGIGLETVSYTHLHLKYSVKQVWNGFTDFAKNLGA